jgi:hypothetical protein
MPDREERYKEYQAWCAVHDCHPHDCFRTHYPWAYREDRERDG